MSLTTVSSGTVSLATTVPHSESGGSPALGATGSGEGGDSHPVSLHWTHVPILDSRVPDPPGPMKAVPGAVSPVQGPLSPLTCTMNTRRARAGLGQPQQRWVPGQRF